MLILVDERTGSGKDDEKADIAKTTTKDRNRLSIAHREKKKDVEKACLK